MINTFSELEEEKYKASLLQEVIDLDFSRSVSQCEEMKKIVVVTLEKIQLEIEAFKAILPPTLRLVPTVLRSRDVRAAYKCSHNANWRVAYPRFTDAVIAVKGNDEERHQQIICRMLYGYLVIPASEFVDFFGEGVDKNNILYVYDPLTGKKTERSFQRAVQEARSA